MDTAWIKEKVIYDPENNKRSLDIGQGKIQWPAQIIYHHCGYVYEYTAVFDLEIPPSALIQDALDRLIRNETILIKAGFAYCHEKDQYCKKTGRELAKSKMEYHHFIIRRIERQESEITLTLILSGELNKNLRECLYDEFFTIKFFDNGKIFLC